MNPLAPFDLRQRRFDAEGGPVGTVGRHCLDDIGNGQYPRFREDILSFQTL